jgi:hypothetical protein
MRYLLSLAFVFSLFLTSCTDDSPNTLPAYSGRPGEIIVVSTKSQWEGLIGDSIKSVFYEAQYGLPQDEPYFNLIQTTAGDFERVFKTFRNVFVVDIDPNRMSKAELDIKRSVYAKGQLVATIHASNAAEFAEVLDKNHSQLINFFNNKELDRLYRRNKRMGDAKVKEQLFTDYHLSITPMPDAYIASSDTNVAWIRLERKKALGGFDHQISQGLLIYYEPYLSKSQLLDSIQVETMKKYLKKYVPGPSENSYMSIDTRFITPQSDELNFKDHYAKEFRGLWRMENYLMGGPMIALTVLDEDRDRIVTAIGYVYAPQFDKREFLREVDAMVKSLSFKTKK